MQNILLVSHFSTLFTSVTRTALEDWCLIASQLPPINSLLTDIIVFLRELLTRHIISTTWTKASSVDDMAATSRDRGVATDLHSWGQLGVLKTEGAWPSVHSSG